MQWLKAFKQSAKRLTMVAPKGKYNTLEVNMLDYKCRELLRLKTDDSQRLESRIRYYCGFDLLFIRQYGVAVFEREEAAVILIDKALEEDE